MSIVHGHRPRGLDGIAAAVVVVSDRRSRGHDADLSGPRAVDLLRAAGLTVGTAAVVPDGADQVEQTLRAVLAGPVRLVVTSGGTGLGPRDQTPEGTRRIIEQELPGVAEAIRRAGTRHTATAVLSRGLVGLTDRRQLVVNLPGSPDGVEQGLTFLIPLLGHVFDQLDGGDHP